LYDKVADASARGIDLRLLERSAAGDNLQLSGSSGAWHSAIAGCTEKQVSTNSLCTAPATNTPSLLAASH